MSEADKLLDGLSESEIAAYTANPETEEHIVIGKDRFISVPEELKRIAVQGDHDVETVTFDCPRYWDDLDLSTMKIYINYMRPDRVTGSYIAQNIRVDNVDDSIMHFEWTISKEVTIAKGSLSFLICVRRANVDDGNLENAWHSELNTEMFISEGMDCPEAILNQYPDIITQILMVSDRANAIAETLENHLAAGDFELGLPIVDENDNGRILRVENGVWSADELRIYEGGVVEETNNSVFIRYSANADGSDFTEKWIAGQSYIGVAAATSAPITASSYQWVRMIAPLDQNVYGNAITNTVSGQAIRVDDVSPIEHTIKAKVQSENLLPYPYTTSHTEKNGGVFTAQEDGGVLASGTPTDYVSLSVYHGEPLLKSGIITVSISGTAQNVSCDLIIRDADTNVLNSYYMVITDPDRTTATINLDDYPTAALWTVSVKRTAANKEMSGVIYPKIEVGDTATDYIKYVDPSTVTVTKCGKNIWSYRPSTTVNGVTITTDENGRIKYSGTCTSSFVIFETISLPAGTYTLSDRASYSPTDSADARTQVYIPSMELDARIYWDSPSNGSATFTLTEASNDVRIRIKGAVGVTYDGYVISPLLELGDKMTEYEPYKSATYTPATDGTCEIISTSPTMTVLSDTEGVNIEFEYNRDSNRVMGDVETCLDAIITEQERVIAIQNTLIGGATV